MATLYIIADWNRHYENNRSRLVRDLTWVPVPNNHDGEAYARIITHKNGAKIFAAWILILQVASRCQPRGELIKSTGEPHDCESLSLKTRAPAAWFSDALPVLTQVGWLTHKELVDKELALGWQEPDAVVTHGCVSTVTEGNGREWKGREEKEEKVGHAAKRSAGASPLSDSEWLASLKVDPAYQGIDVEREYSRMLVWCRENKRQPNRRRFVNWLNRCDKPMATGTASRPTAKPVAEPADWKSFLNHEYPESRFSAGQANEAHQWSDLDHQTQVWLVAELRKRGLL